MVRDKHNRKVIARAVFSIMVALIFVAGTMASQALAIGTDLGGTAIKEKQVVEVNKSLKNVIEENQRLVSKTQELEAEVRRLRSQYHSKQNRVTPGLVQTESLELASLRDADDAGYQKKTSVPKEEVMQLASVTTDDVKAQESKTLDLLSRIDAFSEQDERLRMDSAKAHYNMGNIYFQKGEYEIAAREYYQAVTLMPDDPDSHYNLAFVSSAHLRDWRTAIKHFKMYLYLNPKAKDAHYVRERIVEAQLELDGQIDSPLEEKDR